MLTVLKAEQFLLSWMNCVLLDSGPRRRLVAGPFPMQRVPLCVVPRQGAVSAAEVPPSSLLFLASFFMTEVIVANIYWPSL